MGLGMKLTVLYSMGHSWPQWLGDIWTRLEDVWELNMQCQEEESSK